MERTGVARFLALMLLCLAPVVGEGMPLTKEAALARALERNLGIRTGGIEVEIAESAIGEAAGAFDPEISVAYTSSTSENVDTESLSTGIQGRLSTGATYGLDVSSAEAFDQQGQSRAFSGFSFRQPLLRDFGLSVNLAQLRIARYQFDLSQWEYKQTILDTLADTLFAFNNLYEAQENLAISIRSRDLAKGLVEDNRKRVELGVIAKLDITSAEAQYAFRSDLVLQAANLEKRAQSRLKQLIFDDAAQALASDIVAERYLESQITGDVREFLDTILDDSPRFHIGEIALEIAKLRQDRDVNQNLPSLDLIAQYGFSGTGASLGDSLDAAFSGDEESYSLGAAISYPIFNRTARSRKAISAKRTRIAETDLQRLKQAIKLEFHTSYQIMQTNWERVEAGRYARELAELSLEAEEKKLNAGTSSTFVVLRLQNDLASAELREMAAIANYNRSVAAFNRLRGVLE